MRDRSQQVGGRHYADRAVQPLDVMRDQIAGREVHPEEAVYLYPIVKYILRYGFKNGLEDLKKAQDWLSMLIDFFEERETPDDEYVSPRARSNAEGIIDGLRERFDDDFWKRDRDAEPSIDEIVKRSYERLDTEGQAATEEFMEKYKEQQKPIDEDLKQRLVNAHNGHVEIGERNQDVIRAWEIRTGNSFSDLRSDLMKRVSESPMQDLNQEIDESMAKLKEKIKK